MRILTTPTASKKSFCQIYRFITLYRTKLGNAALIVQSNRQIYAINIEEFTKKVQFVSFPIPPASDERRQYFRIKNSLYMSYQVMNAEAKQSGVQELATQSVSLRVLKELSEIKQKNKDFLNTLHSDQTAISTHINQQNSQISTLSNYLVQNVDTKYKKLFEVDLSGGGIRFESTTQLEKDQELKLHIILIPEYRDISLLGRVVKSQRLDDKEDFEHSITFSQIQEADRDAIIKHVFKTQSKQLRADKSNSKQTSESKSE